MAEGHDFHRVPLVETDTGLASSDEATPEDTGRVEITSFDPERVVLVAGDRDVRQFDGAGAHQRTWRTGPGSPASSPRRKRP